MAQTQSWYTPKPKSFVLTPQYYKECVEQAVSYNGRLCIDRKHRMPFLDSQTGVAQNCCSLWQQPRFRRIGRWPTQLYSYPAKRWRKKKRAFYNDYAVTKARDIETGENDLQTISAMENPAVAANLDSAVAGSEVSGEASKDAWYDDIDQLDEPPDAGEIDYHNSDSSDYEETYVKRRKKKKRAGGPGRGRKSSAKNLDDPESADKPYACDLCCARYKTRPGLTYHLNHNHNSAALTDDEEIVVPVAPPTPKILLPASSAADSQNGKSPRTREPKSKSGPNNYCDFCLGDEEENKKTGTREELVSCADCGRSGHPSCLQFTPNMIISVKKYPWQCIECKSCGLCGTSDNDDQLLFCDDCDRGYHMYCLTPPLSEPPEGSWSCHLCIAEFYGGKKPDSMA